MKKIVSIACALVLVYSSAIALTGEKIAGHPIKLKSVKSGVVKENTAPLFTRDMTFTPSTAYDYGYHGFSQYRMEGDRISWEPANGLIATVYDPKNVSAGKKATGAMTGVWGDELTTHLVNDYTASTIWFASPDICGIDNYKVALLPTTTVNANNQYLYISVFNNDLGEWATKVPVITGTSTPQKVSSCHGDLTKDGNGNYYLLMSIVYESSSYTNRKLALIVGKTTDPSSGNWTFTDYTANSFTVSATDAQLTTANSNFRAIWGTNGFGFAAVQCETVETAGNSTVGYVYTKDYGQNWIKATGDKMFTIPVDNTLLPWVGTTFVGTDNAPVTIEHAVFSGNVTLNVDKNNDVHVMVHAWGGAGTNYWPNLPDNEAGVPVSGYYHLGYKFGADGLPEANAAWKANLIAQGVGMLASDNAEGAENTTESKYTNNRGMNISCGDDGTTLVACWTDRPVNNPMYQDEFGTLVGFPSQDNWHGWIHNPYISYSFNGGETWASSRTDSVQRGFEIQTYTDNKIEELGFSIAKKCVVTGTGDTRSIETYASYAIPNLNAPGAADLALLSYYSPGCEHAFWEQSWYIMQVKLDGLSGIKTTPVAYNKNFALEQNYPNPFNPTTAIEFNLKNEASVNLSVYNANGQMVSELVNSKMNSGLHTANFNASSLNSGVYFYKLTVDGQSAVKKMVLTK